MERLLLIASFVALVGAAAPPLIAVGPTFTCSVLRGGSGVECFGSSPELIRPGDPTFESHHDTLDPMRPVAYTQLPPNTTVLGVAAGRNLVCVTTTTPQVLCWAIVSLGHPYPGSPSRSAMTDPFVTEEGAQVTVSENTFCYFPETSRAVCKEVQGSDTVVRANVSFEGVVTSASFTGGNDLCVATSSEVACHSLRGNLTVTVGLSGARDVVAFPDGNFAHVSANGSVVLPDVLAEFRPPHGSNSVRLPNNRVNSSNVVCWLNVAPASFVCAEHALFMEDVAVDVHEDFAWQVAMNDRHACARGENATTLVLVCWGFNGDMQLGTTKPSPPHSRVDSFHQRVLVHGVPYPEAPFGVKSLHSQMNTALASTWGCLRDLYGAVRCFGACPLFNMSLDAPPVPFVGPSKHVAVGADFGCSARSNDSVVECWNPCEPTPRTFPFDNKGVLAGPETDGASRVCAITRSLQLLCRSGDTATQILAEQLEPSTNGYMLAVLGNGTACVALVGKPNGVVRCWTVDGHNSSFTYQDTLDQLSGRAAGTLCYLSSATGVVCNQSDSVNTDAFDLPSSGVILPDASPLYTGGGSDCVVGVEQSNAAYVGDRNAYLSSCVGAAVLDLDRFPVDFFTYEWNINMGPEYVCFTGYAPVARRIQLVCNGNLPPTLPSLWNYTYPAPPLPTPETRSPCNKTAVSVPKVMSSVSFTCALDGNSKVRCFGSARTSSATTGPTNNDAATHTLSMSANRSLSFDGHKILAFVVGADFGCGYSDDGKVRCWTVWANASGSYTSVYHKTLNSFLGHPYESVRQHLLTAGADFVCVTFTGMRRRVMCATYAASTLWTPVTKTVDLTADVRFSASTATFVCALSSGNTGCLKVTGTAGSPVPTYFSTPTPDRVKTLESSSTEIHVKYIDRSLSASFVFANETVVQVPFSSVFVRRRLLQTTGTPPPTLADGLEIVRPENGPFGTGSGCLLVLDSIAHTDTIVCAEHYNVTLLPDGASNDMLREPWMVDYNWTLSEGETHVCASGLNIYSLQTIVICWGGNEYGQLGTGDTDARRVADYVVSLTGNSTEATTTGNSKTTKWYETTNFKIAMGVTVPSVVVILIIWIVVLNKNGRIVQKFKEKFNKLRNKRPKYAEEDD